MITINGENYLTYEETARILHVTKQHVYNLVAQKQLTSVTIGDSGKSKFLLQKEVLLRAQVTTNNDQSLPVPTNSTQTFPIASQSMIAIKEVRQVYSLMTQTLTTSLESTLQPLVKTVVDTDITAFFDMMSKLIASILNKILELSPEQMQNMALDEQVTYLMQDIDIPDVEKRILTTAIIKSLNDARQQIAS